MGMDEHRHAGRAEDAEQSVQASGVVKVPVAADDRPDRGWINVQAAHILHDPVRAGAGVEQHPMLVPGFGDGDQHRESVFGDQGVRDLTVGHHRTWPNRPRLWTDLVGRPLVGHEQVQRVVHQRGHRDGIDRFEVEYLNRSHVVQEPVRIAPRGLIDAHAVLLAQEVVPGILIVWARPGEVPQVAVVRRRIPAATKTWRKTCCPVGRGLHRLHPCPMSGRTTLRGRRCPR